MRKKIQKSTAKDSSGKRAKGGTTPGQICDETETRDTKFETRQTLSHKEDLPLPRGRFPCMLSTPSDDFQVEQKYGLLPSLYTEIIQMMHDVRKGALLITFENILAIPSTCIAAIYPSRSKNVDHSKEYTPAAIQCLLLVCILTALTRLYKIGEPALIW